MGIEDLKDSLHNNFSLMEYFDKSFSFFSKFLRENKGLVIAYILISIISNLSARFINLDGIKTETLFSSVLLAFLIFLIFYFPTTLLIKKIQNRMVVDIEGISAEVSYKELFLKIIKCVLAIFVLIVVATVIFRIVALISRQLAIILYVGGVVFIALHLLYFNSLYYIRDVKIFDAVTYNVHLCKGNRLRIIIPSVIVCIFAILVNIPFNILRVISGNLLIFNYAVISVNSILNSLIFIFYTMLLTLIFLNVEYMDLEKMDYDEAVIE
jgi:putative membrane protein